MAGMVLPMITSCTRSPWFKATREITTAYGDHEGRLTPVTFDRPIAEEYRVLRTKAGILMCRRSRWKSEGRMRRRSLTMCSRGLSAPWPHSAEDMA